MKTTMAGIIAGAASALACTVAMAQSDYPAKPISIVVTFGAGSGSDVAARLYAKALKDKLNATAVVDLKPGAAGMIGAQAVARAAPDGYTLLMGSGTVNAANYPLFRDRITYQPQSFAVAGILYTSPATLFAARELKGEGVAEVLAEAGRGGRKLSCGSGNAVTQVACEMLKRKTGLDIVTVNYKGNAQSLTDLAGGQITVAFSDLAAAAPFMQRGAARPIAVPSRSRHATLPQVTTFAEQGIADFDFLSWNGIFVPAGTPAEIVGKLNEVVRHLLTTPEWESLRLSTAGLKVSGELKEAQDFVTTEIAKWERYVRESGVKGSE